MKEFAFYPKKNKIASSAKTHAALRSNKKALTPAKVRVLKTEGTGMEIDWEDGHASHWNFKWLRDACPCATCVEERQVQKREPGQPKPKAPQLLQL